MEVAGFSGPPKRPREGEAQDLHMRQSCLSASTGSTREARLAGISADPIATAASTSAATEKLRKSKRLTP
jgi:hypothetical protein